MWGGHRSGGWLRRARGAAGVAVFLGVGFSAGAAHASGAWCGELPASLDGSETPALCGAAARARAGLATAGEPAPLAHLLRLPAVTQPDTTLATLPLRDPPAMAVSSGRRLLLRLGLFAGVVGALAFAADAPKEPRWSSTPGFDDDARSGLRAGSRGGRRAASLASDILLASLGGQLLADWYLQRERYPAARSAAVDASWLLFNEVVASGAKSAAGRERPYAEPCRLDASYVESCNDGRGDNESFFSGHASWSATLAGLVCARAEAFEPAPEAGIRWGAVAWCGLAVSASVATGLLRVAADQHHLSDVGVGWTSGFVSGYVLPRTFDYRGARGGPFSRFTLEPMRVGDAWGVRTALRF